MNSTPPLRNLPVGEARSRMLAATAVLDSRLAPLDQALGAVLAEPLTARRDQPPFDASAMDGWAVKRSDVRGGVRLLIAGESAAGRPFEGVLQPGQAVRIFTGAPVPTGADRVVIQEEAAIDGDHVTLGSADQNAASHIRPRGGDLAADVIVLPAGDRFDPWKIALAAAAGHAIVPVVRAPVVAILTNGEELAPPGAEPGPFQICDSGGPGLAALVSAWGGAPLRLPAAGDDAGLIRAAIETVQADLIVVIGGASVGDHDLVKPALQTLGLNLAVETVLVRPGKPTWFGRLADGRRVLGLPGNPASAFVCAQLFLRPIIDAMLGRQPEPFMTPAILAQPLAANGPREHWMRAAVSVDGQGRMTVTPFSDQDSSLVGVFARADALLRRSPAAPAASAGEIVEILLLGRTA